jgi:hypothetical protein
VSAGIKIMTKITKTLVLALMASGIALAASSAAQAQAVGVNAAIRNSVQMKTSADRALRKAVLKERVSLNDDIVTGQASVLQILLLDRTSFTVGANARAKIDRFVYDPNRKASAVGASVAKGAFRFMSGKPTHAMPGQSGIRTPVASIGVRGTIVEGVVGEDANRIARGEASVGAAAGSDAGATLIVLRGPGRATQGNETPGAIDVTTAQGVVAVEAPGLALFIPGPNASPVGPFQISDAGLDALHMLLRTNPDRKGSQASILFENSPIVDMTFECEGGGFQFVDPVTGQVFIEPGGSGCRTGD